MWMAKLITDRTVFISSMALSLCDILVCLVIDTKRAVNKSQSILHFNIVSESFAFVDELL